MRPHPVPQALLLAASLALPWSASAASDNTNQKASSSKVSVSAEDCRQYRAERAELLKKYDMSDMGTGKATQKRADRKMKVVDQERFRELNDMLNRCE